MILANPTMAFAMETASALEPLLHMGAMQGISLWATSLSDANPMPNGLAQDLSVKVRTKLILSMPIWLTTSH